MPKAHDIVYSANTGPSGQWRVYLRSSNAVDDGVRISNDGDAYNHKWPTIDDAGTVIYFKDGGSGGIGYQVIRLNPSTGAESVVEFSSRSGTSERMAGRHTGIASDGTIVWTYDFFNPYPSRVRRFNVSGIGRLGPDFISLGHPDININGDLVYTTGMWFWNERPGGPYHINISNARNLSPALVTDGTKARLNDDGDVLVMTGPLSTFYSEDITESSDLKLVLGANEESTVMVGSGVWADLTDRDQALIAVEKPDATGRRQVFTTRFLQGIDASFDAVDWDDATSRYAPAFYIQAAWGGRNPFANAEAYLSAVPGGIFKAAYVLLNFDDSSRRAGAPAWQTGGWQVEQALAAIGSQVGALSFLAVDVEQPNPGVAGSVNGILPMRPEDKYRRRQRVAEAVQAVLDAGLRPIIYAFRGASASEQWRGITGDSTAFSMFPLWHPNYAVNHVGGNGENPLKPPPWEDSLDGFTTFGGWIERAGRQYVDNRLDAGYTVDLNLFQPSLFIDAYERPPSAIEVAAVSWQGETGPNPHLRVTGTGLSFKVLRRSPLLVRRSGSVTIQNIGAAAIPGPLQLEFSNLVAGYTLLNASGNRGNGSYIVMPVEVHPSSSGSLLYPGEAVTTEVHFEGNNTAIVNYLPRVYSGYW